MDVLRSGFFQGKLPGRKNNWSLYYMELTHSHLLIHEAGDDTEDVEGIQRHLCSLKITGGSSVAEEKSKKPKEHKFHIQTPGGRYIFKCHSAEVKNEWVMRIQKIITVKSAELDVAPVMIIPFVQPADGQQPCLAHLPQHTKHQLDRIPNLASPTHSTFDPDSIERVTTYPKWIDIPESLTPSAVLIPTVTPIPAGIPIPPTPTATLTQTNVHPTPKPHILSSNAIATNEKVYFDTHTPCNIAQSNPNSRVPKNPRVGLQNGVATTNRGSTGSSDSSTDDGTTSSTSNSSPFNARRNTTPPPVPIRTDSTLSKAPSNSAQSNPRSRVPKYPRVYVQNGVTTSNTGSTASNDSNTKTSTDGGTTPSKSPSNARRHTAPPVPIRRDLTLSTTPKDASSNENSEVVSKENSTPVKSRSLTTSSMSEESTDGNIRRVTPPVPRRKAPPVPTKRKPLLPGVAKGTIDTEDSSIQLAPAAVKMNSAMSGALKGTKTPIPAKRRSIPKDASTAEDSSIQLAPAAVKMNSAMSGALKGTKTPIPAKRRSIPKDASTAEVSTIQSRPVPMKSSSTVPNKQLDNTTTDISESTTQIRPTPLKKRSTIQGIPPKNSPESSSTRTIPVPLKRRLAVGEAVSSEFNPHDATSLPPVPKRRTKIVSQDSSATGAIPTAISSTTTSPTATLPTTTLPTTTSPTAISSTAISPTATSPTTTSPTATSPTATSPTATSPEPIAIGRTITILGKGAPKLCKKNSVTIKSSTQHCELEGYSWFWGAIGKEECEQKLQTEGVVGNFIVRISASGKYVISCRREDGIHHYRLLQQGSRFRFEKATVNMEWRTLLHLLDVFVRSSKESLTRPFDSDELDNDLYSIVQFQEDGQPTWCLPQVHSTHQPVLHEDLDGSVYFDTPI